jgi:copper chaperone CopZ
LVDTIFISGGSTYKGYLIVCTHEHLDNLSITLEEAMQKVTYETPALYGDHHVTEIRRILLELSGVIDVYASSAFQIVEVTYDPENINDLEIAVKLDAAGYLGEWAVPIEAGATAYHSAVGLKPYFRHTAAYEQTHLVVSFAQNVSYLGRPLWPCPGMGVISKPMED